MKFFFALLLTASFASLASAFDGVPEWRHIGAGRITDGVSEWNAASIPNELKAEWKKDRGQISGRPATETASVAGKMRSQFGKELRWEIKDDSQVASRLFLLSRHVETKSGSGPKGWVRVLDADQRELGRLRVAKQEYEVVYLRMGKGVLRLSDLSEQAAVSIKSPKFPLTLAFGVVARKGEHTDSRIRIEKDSALVPVYQQIDPIGAPQGIVTGLSSRFYVWYGPNHWHLRVTSKKYVRFRGIIRVLNGGLASVKQVGFERSQVDSWRYDAKKGEIHFAFKCGPSFDGIDFRIVGQGSFVEFDLQTLGKKNPRVVFVGRERKNPTGVPFAFPGRPATKKK